MKRRRWIVASLLFFPLVSLGPNFIDSLAMSQCKVLQERRSGSKVFLLGCMHFNPFSSFSARRVAQTVCANGTAVVLEMFDQRWQRMLEVHSDGEMRLLFDNEMQAVAEIANASGIPIAFADLSDEELDVVFDRVINETLTDVQEPFSGWIRIWKDLSKSISLFSPDAVGQLEGSSESPLSRFLSTLFLLVASPVALLRNLLVLAMEAPFSNTAGLLLIFLAIPAVLLSSPDLWQGSATSSTSSSADAAIVNCASLLLMLPMLALWRILLRAIITERDAHIAEKIRTCCQGHQTVLVVLGSLHVPGVSRNLRRV